MKNRLRLAAIAVAAAVPLSLSAGVASAYDDGGYAPGYGEQTGSQGCTPGYWKNHTDSWQGYQTTTRLSTVFAATPAAYTSTTLQQALSFPGGNGVDGAARILLRAATAAVLNAAHDGVDYRDTTREIVTAVNGALASGDRSAILALAASLDTANNAGCTLN